MSPSYQDAPDLSTPASTSAVAQQKNGGLMAITVVCLILGLLGLLTSIFGLTMLPSQETISQMQSGQPGMLGDFQVKMAEIQQSQFIPNLVVIGLNLIVGTLLIVGSIDVLKTKEWGCNLLRNALLAAAIFVVLRGIYHIWVEIRVKYSMKGFMQEMMPALGGNEDAVAIGMQISFGIRLVIGLLWPVGLSVFLSGFYLWSRMCLNKPSIKVIFNTAS